MLIGLHIWGGGGGVGGWVGGGGGGGGGAGRAYIRGGLYITVERISRILRYLRQAYLAISILK